MKKIIYSAWLFCCFCGFLPQIWASPTINWLPAEMTPTGNTKIESYDMPQFSQGLMLYTQEIQGEERYGYFNQNGAVVIAPTFLGGRKFSEDLAAVKTLVPKAELELTLGALLGEDITLEEEGLFVARYGYINTQGTWVIPPIYEDAYGFSQGLAAVSLMEGHWGYIDPTGNWKILPQYTWAGDFNQGYAIVTQGLSYGIVNTEGNFAISPIQTPLTGGNEGLFGILGESGYGVITATGSAITPLIYSSLGYYSDGLALIESQGRWGYLNVDGSVAIEPQYPQAFHFHQGLAWVRDNGQYQFLDCNGRVYLQLPSEVSEVTSFSSGNARVKEGIYYGFIDRSGETVVPVIYRDAIPLSEGVGLVYDGSRWGLFRPEIQSADWATVYIATSQQEGLLPESFWGLNYHQPINRTQFVTLAIHCFDEMARAKGWSEESLLLNPALSQNPFRDTNDLWVRRGYALGIVGGMSADYFAAYETVTREEAAAILAKIYEEIFQQSTPSSGGLMYVDDATISSWAVDKVHFLSGLSVISGVGDGYFAPKSPITAQEAVIMTWKLGNL